MSALLRKKTVLLQLPLQVATLLLQLPLQVATLLLQLPLWDPSSRVPGWTGLV